jgi:hypothetical protein
MSIAPDMTPKSCFIPCPDWKIKSGQCSCHNYTSNIYWTKDDIDQLNNEIKVKQRDRKIDDIIKDDKDKNGNKSI